MKNRTLILFSLAACAGLFSGILIVHASDHPSTDVGMELLIQEAVASHQMQMQMTLVKESVSAYRAEFALHDGSGDTVMAPALALDADPAPARIELVSLPAHHPSGYMRHHWTASSHERSHLATDRVLVIPSAQTYGNLPRRC